jgi:glycosyltransferase involved in cell wall biosynthesis
MSTAGAPRVTVLLPAYQAERYVCEAVDSLLAQTLTASRILVLDDGSTDGTPAALERYRDEPRVEVVRQERNVGMAVNLNLGLELARTEYVARMDADDRSHPERLARQVHHLDSHQGTVVVGTACRLIDADGHVTGTEPVLQRDADLRRLLYLASPFTHGSVMYRRDAVRAAGGYDGRWWPAEDYALWCRLGGGFANLPQTLYDYREHPGGSSRVEQTLQAARITEALCRSRRAPRLSPVDLLAGAWTHRRELRWYLWMQRFIRSGLRDLTHGSATAPGDQGPGEVNG